MKITKNSVVSIRYTLTNDAGDILDSSHGQRPLDYLHGAGNIIDGLEAGLKGKKAGDKFKIKVAPEQGYGLVKPELRKVLSREIFADAPALTEGLQFRGETEHGTHIYTVIKIEGDEVTVDGNHPLAGQTLHFDVQVVDVREATPEEIAHGHVHGPHGHEHYH